MPILICLDPLDSCLSGCHILIRFRYAFLTSSSFIFVESNSGISIASNTSIANTVAHDVQIKGIDADSKICDTTIGENLQIAELEANIDIGGGACDPGEGENTETCDESCLCVAI